MLWGRGEGSLLACHNEIVSLRLASGVFMCMALNSLIHLSLRVW